MAKAKIVQFRRGRHKIHERHYVIDVSAKNKEDAKKFIGKEIVWTSTGGKKIKGKISASHGNKGMARAIFETGLPGQAMNNEVEVK